MEDLAFVPRKNVATYLKRGYRIVPGNCSPRTWAVLMRRASDGEPEVTEAPLPKLGPIVSNKRQGSRARAVARAKLSQEDVLRIRAAKGVHTYEKLAFVYGVSHTAIRDVMTGRAWAWL